MPRPDLSAYDLVAPVEYATMPHQGTSNTTLVVHTGAGRYIWKHYGEVHHLASLRYEHDLLLWLDSTPLRFAVPAPVATRHGTTLLRQDVRWIHSGVEHTRHRETAPRRFSGGRWSVVRGHSHMSSLTRYVDGERCDPTNLDDVELLGAVTAELQHVLQAMPTNPRPGKPLFGALFDFPRPRIEPLTLTPRDLGAPVTREDDARCAWWREQAAQLEPFANDAYGLLPRQVCHNDVTPANVIIDHGRVSAVLDFEFACPVARALDVAMGLRMTMRIWENPDPWDAVRRYMRGYRRFMTLTPAEIEAMPMLLRLRSAIPILWAMSRPNTPVLRGIEYVQNMVRWLEVNDQQLIHVIAEAPYSDRH